MGPIFPKIRALLAFEGKEGAHSSLLPMFLNEQIFALEIAALSLRFSLKMLLNSK
jgi:hypothetical protein